ncbi:MAG TPA: anthranilate phosphoribosyltransferase, partial [Alphaproteobacteria bacterium]|nr:anthranilate phosphoribosyltransferase [Alphaproteobacteria bacterium]
LEGRKGPYRDIVVLNAAAALIVAEKAENLHDGAAMAQAAIDNGAAQAALDKLVTLSNAEG